MEQGSVPLGILAPTLKGGGAAFVQNAVPGAVLQQTLPDKVVLIVSYQAHQNREGASQ